MPVKLSEDIPKQRRLLWIKRVSKVSGARPWGINYLKGKLFRGKHLRNKSPRGNLLRRQIFGVPPLIFEGVFNSVPSGPPWNATGRTY